LPEFEKFSLIELCELIEKEILILCQAHFDRYFELPQPGADNSA